MLKKSLHKSFQKQVYIVTKCFRLTADISTGSNEIPGYFSGVRRSSEAGDQVPVSIKGLELINPFISLCLKLFLWHLHLYYQKSTDKTYTAQGLILLAEMKKLHTASLCSPSPGGFSPGVYQKLLLADTFLLSHNS